MERSSLPVSNNAHKTYPVLARELRVFDDTNDNGSGNNRLNQRRESDSPRRSNGSSKNFQSPSTYSLSQTSKSRRSLTNDGLKSFGQHRQSPPPAKPQCILPTTVCQPGYVTPSKLFNMMGYGLEKQYLFMHAHYLYIIDCRTREKFNASHIVTGKKFYYFFI